MVKKKYNNNIKNKLHIKIVKLKRKIINSLTSAPIRPSSILKQ